MKRFSRWWGAAGLCAAIAVSAASQRAAAVEVEWGFDDASLSTVYNDHTSVMEFRNGATTSAAVTFNTASGFGLPAMPGGDATAMGFTPFDQNQALGIYNLGAGNGGGAFVNQYTLAWDVLIPDTAAGWQSFYQTSASNTGTNDGDFFMRPADAGVGISGSYHGALLNNTWHRVAIAVDQAANSMAKYIDGIHVGTTTISGGVDGRWSLYPDGSGNVAPNYDMFILADNDGDTSTGYISMFYYTDGLVDAETIRLWGGADADGIKGVPEPASLALAAMAVLGVCLVRRRKSK